MRNAFLNLPLQELNIALPRGRRSITARLGRLPTHDRGGRGGRGTIVRHELLRSPAFGCDLRRGLKTQLETAASIEVMGMQDVPLSWAGGRNNPDFIGAGAATGLNFDVTTNTPRAINAHLARPYGPGLILGGYSRPTGFMVFP